MPNASGREAKTEESDVDIFVSYFHNTIDAIRDLKVDPDPNGDRKTLFQRALYMGVIDALSKTVYPKRGNRDRFVCFIRSFAKWQYSEKVSLPHLLRLASRNPEPELSKLREYANAEISKWRQGEVIKLDRDPDDSSVVRFWPKGSEYKELNDWLDSLRHVHLLYAYRNFLVHEMRKPGRGIDFDNDDQWPYYHSMTHVDQGRETGSWELVYPVRFIEQLCTEALRNLRDHYVTQRLNPSDNFAFGTYWIEELNR